MSNKENVVKARGGSFGGSFTFMLDLTEGEERAIMQKVSKNYPQSI